jgi:anti-anti-sigma factor
MALARSPSSDDVASEAGPPPVMWREGARTVVSLRGEHDMSTATDLADALAAASAVGDGDVVVDLSEVRFMDSTIITELARGQDALRSQSRALMLRAPSKFARRLLEVCGLVGPSDPSRQPRRARSVHA